MSVEAVPMSPRLRAKGSAGRTGRIVEAVSVSLDQARTRTGRAVIFDMYVHLLFVTKYRRNVLSELRLRDLTEIFAKVCRDFGAGLKQCSGEDDHLQLLVVYPPKLTVSKLLNRLEGLSSRLLREHCVLWSLFRRPLRRRTARGHCRVYPQPTKGRAFSLPRRTGFPARKLR